MPTARGPQGIRRAVNVESESSERWYKIEFYVKDIEGNYPGSHPTEWEETHLIFDGVIEDLSISVSPPPPGVQFMRAWSRYEANEEAR